MAQRTRLFQQPRSPLIQGQSKLRRPLWQEWGQCVVVTVVAFVAYPVVIMLMFSDASNAAVWDAVTPSAVLGLEVGVVVGGAAVLFARGMGWTRPWLVGAVLATLTSAILWAAWPAVR